MKILISKNLLIRKLRKLNPSCSFPENCQLPKDTERKLIIVTVQSKNTENEEEENKEVEMVSM